MKGRMTDFANQYENELSQFRRILATGTTGNEVQNVCKKLKNSIILCKSGPKGGDIEIATEILFGCCNIVIFFIDPLNPHPHIDDIRVVLSAAWQKYLIAMYRLLRMKCTQGIGLKRQSEGEILAIKWELEKRTKKWNMIVAIIWWLQGKEIRQRRLNPSNLPILCWWPQSNDHHRFFKIVHARISYR